MHPRLRRLRPGRPRRRSQNRRNHIQSLLHTHRSAITVPQAIRLLQRRDDRVARMLRPARAVRRGAAAVRRLWCGGARGRDTLPRLRRRMCLPQVLLLKLGPTAASIR